MIRRLPSIERWLAPGWLAACWLVGWSLRQAWFEASHARLGPAWLFAWAMGMFAWLFVWPSAKAASVPSGAAHLVSAGWQPRFGYLAGGAALVAATGLVLAGAWFHQTPAWLTGISLGMAGLGVLTFGPWGIVRGLLLVPLLLVMIRWPERLEELAGSKAEQLVGLTTSSTLQFLGVPAIQDGNHVWVWDRPLAFTTTHLTMGRLMGIGSLVWAYAICSTSSLVSRAGIVTMAAPIAVISVSLQLVTAALGSHHLSPSLLVLDETWLGVLTIPLALILAMFVDWYVGKLVASADPISMRELVSVVREPSNVATAVAAPKR